MASLNISIPDDQRRFIEQRAADAGFASVEQYINHLIEQDQQRAAQQQLDRMLLEGLESGDGQEATDSWWRDKREAFLRRH